MPKLACILWIQATTTSIHSQFVISSHSWLSFCRSGLVYHQIRGWRLMISARQHQFRRILMPRRRPPTMTELATAQWVTTSNVHHSRLYFLLICHGIGGVYPPYPPVSTPLASTRTNTFQPRAGSATWRYQQHFVLGINAAVAWWEMHRDARQVRYKEELNPPQATTAFCY